MVSAMEKRVVSKCEDAGAKFGLVVGMLGGAAGGVAAGIPVGIAVTGAVTLTVGSGGLAAPFVGLVVGFVTYGGVGMAGTGVGVGLGTAIGHGAGKAWTAIKRCCNNENDSDDDCVSGHDNSDADSDSGVTDKLPEFRGVAPIPEPQQTAQPAIHQPVLKPVVRISYINQAVPYVASQTVGPARQAGSVGLRHPVVRVVGRPVSHRHASHHMRTAYTGVPIMASTARTPRCSSTRPSSAPATYVVSPSASRVFSPPQTPQMTPVMSRQSTPTQLHPSSPQMAPRVPPLYLKADMQPSASTTTTGSTASSNRVLVY